MNITMSLRGPTRRRNQFTIGVGGDGLVDIAGFQATVDGIVEITDENKIRAVSVGSTVLTLNFVTASGAPLPAVTLNITVTNGVEATETGFNVGPVIEGPQM